MKYSPQKIERKWQKIWEEQKIFEAKNFSKKPKFYCLDMFPYPSGEGLHVGHPRGYIATDIISHYMRKKGFNVLHPMGWDAFGLPAENYAIKTGIHPAISTRRNIKRFKKQIKSLGLSYDWSREINTTDPEYYKWTQWIFLLLFKKGLAYEAVLPINFCPSCKTGLANEEVIGEKCERCGTKVTKKNLRQWVLKITAYADRLLEDLKGLDWPEKIVTMQKNWIGRSEGWEIKFQISNATLRGVPHSVRSSKFQIEVFTTRVDTLFGCTYLVIAPEHPLLEKLKNKITNYKFVKEYIEKAKLKTERERISELKEKSGVGLRGIFAINPANGRKIPIFVADYVLIHYGTGAIMAVPSHDQRDFDFAKSYNLPIIEVIVPQINTDRKTDLHRYEMVYEGEGFLINSGRFTGMKSEDAKERIGQWLARQGLAEKAVNYKLRDWIFSRQRYWGEPMPLVFCNSCKKRAESLKSQMSNAKNKFNAGELLNPGWIAIPESELPVELPRVKHYQPTGTGESPLVAIEKWVNTKCPKCKGPAKRETNTMPQWAGSCWYFLRYADPKNKKSLLAPKKIKYWLPVDLYVGGAEHAVLHLLYARFWMKVLYDAGIIKFKEPFLKLRNQGLILAPDGQKMSKSRGNVINPDDFIKKYGADSFRLYEMFMGPFEEVISWNIKSIQGCYRFLQRIWKLAQKTAKKTSTLKKGSFVEKDSTLERLLHKTIKKVTEDIENLRFNTAVSALMIIVNEFTSANEKIGKKEIKILLQLLSPFAPHITEELWGKLGFPGYVLNQKWPKYDPKLVKEKMITLVIQINGKIRDKIEVESDISEEKAGDLALNREKIEKWIGNEKIKKIIFIPGKLINFVI